MLVLYQMRMQQFFKWLITYFELWMFLHFLVHTYISHRIEANIDISHPCRSHCDLLLKVSSLLEVNHWDFCATKTYAAVTVLWHGCCLGSATLRNSLCPSWEFCRRSDRFFTCYTLKELFCIFYFKPSCNSFKNKKTNISTTLHFFGILKYKRDYTIVELPPIYDTNHHYFQHKRWPSPTDQPT